MIFSLSALADDDKMVGVIQLNNEGVRELNAEHYDAAIEKFEQALRLDPDYQLARDNLAITCNNKGLKIRAQPAEALKMFHKALLIDEENPVTRQNIEGILGMMGRNPFDYKERIALAESALRAGDSIGAAIEYGEALRLHKDPEIRNKREDILDSLDETLPLLRPKHNQEQDGREISVRPADEIKTADIKEYMRNLQRRIKRWWFPPKASKLPPVVLRFKIDKSGTVSNVQLDQPSGMSLMDGSALDAVQKAAPMQPLPSDAADGINILCTFCYKPKEDTSHIATDTEDLGGFGPFMADLQRRIKRAWYPSKGKESKRVVVRFKVHRLGELSDLQLERTSGDKIADDAALEAVRKAEPFENLPEGAADQVDIQFTFDYNVFGSSSPALSGGEQRTSLPVSNKNDVDQEPPTAIELARLDLSKRDDVLLAKNYAAAYERSHDLAAALKLYEQIGKALIAESTPHASEIAANTTAVDRVKRFAMVGGTTNQSSLIALVIKCLKQLDNTQEISKSTKWFLQIGLAGDVVRSKCPIPLIKETLNNRTEMNLVHKLSFSELLLRESLANHDQSPRINEFRSLVKNYQDALKLQDQSSESLEECGARAQVLLAKGKIAEAQKTYEQAIAGLKKAGAPSWQLERVLESYGDMLNRTGQKQHAALVYAEAKAMWMKSNK